MAFVRRQLLFLLFAAAANGQTVTSTSGATVPTSTSGVVTSTVTASQISATATSTIAASQISTTATSTIATSQPTVTATVTASATTQVGNFPPLGSIPRDYSPAALERLWDIVGPVEAPPFTTTPVPTAPVVLPSSPPPMYPSFYAPAPKDVIPNLKLPKGFKFGVATAAYQVEGAVKNEGKGPIMWDWASRIPGVITDNTTADIIDLHYFLYKEDVARIAALGVNAHSFSISWARIFPFGTSDSPLNKAGLDHYSDLIDYHIAHGVEPVVTLFHWDLPVALTAYYGGFTSGEIVNDFVNYAKTIFKAFNGRVKTWYTFNEPRVYCGMSTGFPFNVSYAPGVNQSNAFYVCSYNLLKAHAAAVKAFREMKIQGEIAFKNDDFTGLPWRSNSTEDQEATERHAAFQIGIFADPIYTTGDWPKLMTDILPPSLLPRFTAQEKADILGSADFFAIDPYRNLYVAAPPEGLDACVANTSNPLWPTCNNIMFVDENGWAAGISPDPLTTSWALYTPNTMRALFKDLQRRWPTKKMYVSEFGFTEPFESQRTDLFRIADDSVRTNYYMTYLGDILLSIHEDKVPIAGAFAWAMYDNMEWNSGQSAKFGIQYVNYTTLERAYKRSALALSEFFAAHL